MAHNMSVEIKGRLGQAVANPCQCGKEECEAKRFVGMWSFDLFVIIDGDVREMAHPEGRAFFKTKEEAMVALQEMAALAKEAVVEFAEGSPTTVIDMKNQTIERYSDQVH